MRITALHLYEQLTEATDDKARARIIAEAFGQLEEHYPNLKDVATQAQIRETELRLQNEIKQVEVKMAETRADLIRWVVGVGLLQTTLLTGVLLKIAHLI